MLTKEQTIEQINQQFEQAEKMAESIKTMLAKAKCNERFSSLKLPRVYKDSSRTLTKLIDIRSGLVALFDFCAGG
jgi:hypothetical protein